MAASKAFLEFSRYRARQLMGRNKEKQCECDRCGNPYKRSELKEEWSNGLLCEDCILDLEAEGEELMFKIKGEWEVI